MVVAAVTGPVTATVDGSGFDVTIEADEPRNPASAYGCSGATGGAIPATRGHTMVARFTLSSAQQQSKYKNNELAGHCGVLHALQLEGIDGHYGDQRKVVIMGFGAVSRAVHVS